MSALATLRELGREASLSSSTIFDAIFDRESDTALEIAIRLLEARRNRQVAIDSEHAIELLAEECGLYPYIDPNNFGHVTQTLIEAHAVRLREKLYMHSKQMQILLWLLDGDNVILSAPTSFGKTLLVDAFVARARPDTVVIILPTIALIDECRRRLQKTFESNYQIITNVADVYERGLATIFVPTQERFLQRSDELAIDLLVVDEFYKLDPTRGDTRFETLNLALYRALPHARQCFMTGPHIRGINLGERWTGNFRFVRTDYRTVTVNVIDRSAREQKLEAFLADLRSVGEESSLVFSATPNSAQTLMNDIISAGISYLTMWAGVWRTGYRRTIIENGLWRAELAGA